MSNVDSTRRRVLARGALVVAALAGALGAGSVAVATRAAPGRQVNFQLNGRQWHLVAVGKRPGELPLPGESVSLYGALDGDAGGHFYSSSIFVGAPLGDGPQAASYVESHHFNLEHGTIIGTGTWHVAGTSRFAVIGGTGRYANASGSYEAVQRPLELGGDGTAEFTFNLILPGGANGD